MRIAPGRVSLLAASLVLVAGGAVGCGGSDKSSAASKSASKSEFCGALQSFQDDFANVDPTKDIKGYIKKLKDAADKLQNVGTPSNIPADARAGFELTITEIKQLPDDATLDDLSKIGGNVSDADQKKLDSLDSYITKECPDLKTGS